LDKNGINRPCLEVKPQVDTQVSNDQTRRRRRLVEFFVTAAEVATFFTTMGLISHWQIIVGLILGGALAAPLAAYVCKKIPLRALAAILEIVLTALSVRTIYLVLLPG